MRYEIPAGYVTLVGPWSDQNVDVLVPQRETTIGVNLVVARDTIPCGSVFNDYLAQQREAFARELADFQPVSDNSAMVDERPAHFFEFTWTNHGIKLQQMITAITEGDKVLSVTATVPGIVDGDTRSLLISAMNRFRFGSGDAPIQES